MLRFQLLVASKSFLAEVESGLTESSPIFRQSSNEINITLCSFFIYHYQSLSSSSSVVFAVVFNHSGL